MMGVLGMQRLPQVGLLRGCSHKHCATQLQCPPLLHKHQRHRPFLCHTTLLVAASASPAVSASTPASSPGVQKKKKGRLLSLLPSKASFELLQNCVSVLKSNLWAILIIFAAKDMLSFLLHRLSHRVTNLVAEFALGLSLPSGNPFWLFLDPRFLERHMGYQALIILFFLLCLPLNISINSWAITSAMLLAKQGAEAASSGSGSSSDASGADKGTGTASSSSVNKASSTAPEPLAAASIPSPSPSAEEAFAASSQPMCCPPAAAADPPALASLHTPLEASSAASMEAAEGSGLHQPLGRPPLPASASASACPSLCEDMLADAPTPSSSSSRAGEGSSSSSTPEPSPAGAHEAANQPSTSKPSPPSPSSSSSSSSTRDASKPSCPGSPSQPWDKATASLQQLAAPLLNLFASAPSEQELQEELQRLQQQAGGSSATAAAPRKGLVAQLLEGLVAARAVHPQALALLPGVWRTDLWFNVWALPLQGLSLLMLPALWTLPRLLSIQLALPVAVSEGVSGKAALQRSGELMKGMKAAYIWPFVALIAANRLVDTVRGAVLALMPPRYWQELVELPVLWVFMGSCAKVLILRMQDLLPLAAYYLAVAAEKTQGQQGEASQQQATEEAAAAGKQSKH